MDGPDLTAFPPAAEARGLGPPLVSRRRLAIRMLSTSGYTDRAIVRHGVLDPDVAFLENPVTAAGLGRKVREVLDAR